MLFASTSDPLIRKQDLDRVQLAEGARKARFAARSIMLDGDIKELVRQGIRQIFKNPQNAAKVAIQADTSCNVFRYVAEEIYRYPGARRAFVPAADSDAFDPAGERDPDRIWAALTKNQDPTFRRLLAKELNLDLVMAEALLSVGALNDAVIEVLPGLVRGDVIGPPRVRVFRPHEITVIPDPDEPGRPGVVIYDWPRPDGAKWRVVWTAGWHYYLNDKGVIVQVPGNEGLKNPFGFLPFVPVHNGLREHGFWDQTTGQDLFEATISLEVGWSSIGHALQFSSFAQPILTGVRKEDKGTAPTAIDPAMLWTLPDGVDAKTLDLHADLAGMQGAQKQRLGQAVASYSLLVEDVIGNPGQAPPSGLSRAVKRQPLIERRERLYPFVEEAEFALAALVRWAWNFHHEDAIPEDHVFELQFLPEAIRLSPIDEEDLRRKRLENRKLELEVAALERAAVQTPAPPAGGPPPPAPPEVA